MPVHDQTSNVDYLSLSAAISGSAANDVLLLPAGAYVEDFPDITHSLTINGTGGLASLTRATPLTVSGRAILNVPVPGSGHVGIDLSISGLEISGAARPGANPNGAGILFETGNGNLTVANSWIHNNEDGILTGSAVNGVSPAGGLNVKISHSEINNNGAPAGSTYAANGSDHNIYVGGATSLTVADSYIHSVFSQGNEIKSRALSTMITNNRIDDLPAVVDGSLGSSYDIDIPNGGDVSITGNVIEKGPNSVNRYIIDFGAEGTTNPTGTLVISGNTFINDRPGGGGASGATLLYNATRDPVTSHTVPATISSNTIYDGGGPDFATLLYQDVYGPPNDIALNNSFTVAASPPLDTSHGFGVPEPAGMMVLLFAFAAVTVLRHARFPRPLPA